MLSDSEQSSKRTAVKHPLKTATIQWATGTGQPDFSGGIMLAHQINLLPSALH